MSRFKTVEPASEPGWRAQQHGVEAEQAVESLIQSRGFKLARRAPIGRSIFGTRLVADLRVEGAREWPQGLIVQVISQASRGSADQKFCYLVQNIQNCYPRPAVIVLVGSGFSEKAVIWLCDQVDGHKLLAVLSLDEFDEWTKRLRPVSA